MLEQAGNQTLTSTTAPGKTFSSRSELAQHYKSDWHKYNLKRREAGLPLLQESDFTARWEAALALKKEKEGKAKNCGTDHIKAGGVRSSKKNSNKQNTNTIADNMDTTPTSTEQAEVKTTAPKETEQAQEKPEIDPKQSLFDNHTSVSFKANVKYMHQTYGFFIPDRGKKMMIMILKNIDW
jgi:pre-60S factor REI1